MKYWADITGKDLGAHDTLIALGLNRSASTSEIAYELELYCSTFWQRAEEDCLPDFYELALEMKRDIEADEARSKK